MADIKEDNKTTKWYTLSEAAVILGVSMRTIQRRADKGEYKSKKEGRNRLVQLDIDDIKHDSMSSNGELMSYFKQRTNQLEVELEAAKEHIKEKDRRLQEKDEAANQASARHDMIVMQLTRQLEQSQRLLEHHQDPWYRRMFRRRQKEKQ